LLKIVHDLKKYLWKKLKLKKTQNLSIVTIDKQVGSLVPKVRTTIVVMDSHMAIIQVHIKNNTIEDVLLNGGSRNNIITKQLRSRLGLPKPKHAPYNLKMAYQTTTKLLGLIII
jgi:Ethanolamine utilization protein EutJ (predicted chaperonin)